MQSFQAGKEQSSQGATEQKVPTPSKEPQQPSPKVEQHAEKASQEGAQASAHAEESKEKAAESAQAAKEAAKDATAAAGHAAAEATEVVKQKGVEVYEEAKDAVKSAVDYVKEHLPPVEHTEPTQAEKESQALLEEAAALVDTAPVSPAAPASSPVSGGYRAIDITDKEPAVKPSLASDVAGTNVEVGPFVKEGHMGEVRETPEEVVRSAKGPVEAAKDFVREHMHHHKEEPHVNEWRALPGDIHVPLVTRAFREKVMHRGPATTTGTDTHKTKEPWVGVRMPGYADEPVYDKHGTAMAPRPATTDVDTGVENYLKEKAVDTTAGLRSTGEQISQASPDVKGAMHDVSETMGAKTAAVKDKAKEYYDAAAETVDHAYHSTVDTIKGSVQNVEDKVAETYHNWEQSQVELQPKTVEEARLAHGEIPSNTEAVLHGKAP